MLHIYNFLHLNRRAIVIPSASNMIWRFAYYSCHNVINEILHVVVSKSFGLKFIFGKASRVVVIFKTGVNEFEKINGLHISPANVWSANYQPICTTVILPLFPSCYSVPFFAHWPLANVTLLNLHYQFEVKRHILLCFFSACFTKMKQQWIKQHLFHVLTLLNQHIKSLYNLVQSNLPQLEQQNQLSNNSNNSLLLQGLQLHTHASVSFCHCRS